MLFGINLARGPDGSIGVPAHEPIVGTGDHFLFEVRPDTLFRHDRRFEHSTMSIAASSATSPTGISNT